MKEEGRSRLEEEERLLWLGGGELGDVIAAKVSVYLPRFAARSENAIATKLGA